MFDTLMYTVTKFLSNSQHRDSRDKLPGSKQPRAMSRTLSLPPPPLVPHQISKMIARSTLLPEGLLRRVSSGEGSGAMDAVHHHRSMSSFQRAPSDPLAVELSAGFPTSPLVFIKPLLYDNYY